MRRVLFSICICFSLLFSQLVSANQPPAESVIKNSSSTLEKANTEAKVRLRKSYGKLPPRFETEIKQLSNHFFQFDPPMGGQRSIHRPKGPISLARENRHCGVHRQGRSQGRHQKSSRIQHGHKDQPVSGITLRQLNFIFY